jgi:hypothetical protein
VVASSVTTSVSSGGMSFPGPTSGSVDHAGFFWQLTDGVIYDAGPAIVRIEVGNSLLKAGAGFVF